MTRGAQRGRARRLLGWVAGILAGLVVLAAAGEATVRWFFPQEHLPPDLFVADPQLGYRVARNYRGEYVARTFTVPLVTNSLGLRDHEYGPPPPGTFRVYFLGDSFVFGNRVRVEETVTKVLERDLARRLHPRRVEVVNGGLPGYASLQKLRFFEETADLLQPSLVLLALCVGNDIWDNLLYVTRNPAEGGGGAWRAGAGGWRARLTLLLKRSDLYLLVRRWFNRTVRGGEARVRQAERPPERMPAALRLTEQAVLGLADAAARRGAEFAVLLVPVPESVIPLGTQRDLNERFTAFATAHGIRVYDLSGHFAGDGQGDLYYTVHWTPRGHAVVAAAVEGFLEREGLLDPAADGG